METPELNKSLFGGRRIVGMFPHTQEQVVEKLGYGVWEEEKHPRGESGKFAPKGEGAPSAAPGKLPDIGERVSPKKASSKMDAMFGKGRYDKMPIMMRESKNATALNALFGDAPGLDIKTALSLTDDQVEPKAREMLLGAKTEIENEVASSRKRGYEARVSPKDLAHLESDAAVKEVADRMRGSTREARAVKARAEAWASQAKLPSGFTMTSGKRLYEVYDSADDPLAYTISGPDIQVSLSLGRDWDRKGKGLSFDGTTRFRNADGDWRSFDRRGVEGSFSGKDSEESLTDVVNREIERGRKRAEELKQYVDVPGTGFRVHQDSVPKIAAKLKAGGSHTFEPRGFGTAVTISSKRYADSSPAPKELESMLGVTGLWMSQSERD